MIQSVLVANRGEIARRVFRTCRELGITGVAVHSDADARAAHTREADAAVRLPGDAPADTYLRGDLVVKAALAAGADAVHPGYGFLSENAEFARAVLDAGLTWIGPPPEAIEAMASKTRAKDLMARAGVPLLAAIDPRDATDGDLPLLVKAASGGGGRGMRIVRDLADLPGELAAASTEAASAFGDGEVFVEPYVERGRHVEVQVLADDHGAVRVLGTRDCSLQRRHQKVIEEAPAPGLPDHLRATLHEAAAEAARAIGYRGAGTVEFLVSGERAHFLEMNTRLQVEHPVTELVHGIDLVALQLRVAEGEPLDPEPPAPSGHAVEARLYAEDPARDWQPQTGVMHRLRLPETRHVRLDSGITDGDAISVHYDPLLAKVIAWAPTRAEAVRRLAYVLEHAHLHGPVTNRDLLVRSLRHPDFAAARLDTGFYDRHLADLNTPPDPSAEALSALAAALAEATAHAAGPTLPLRLGGWRNVISAPRTKSYRSEPSGTVHEIAYHHTRDGLRTDDPTTRLLHATPTAITLETDGIARTFDVTTHDRTHVDSPLGAFTFTPLPRFPDPTARTEPGSLLAPMPGTVIRVADVAVGDPVEAGQPLLWLEAMKMEHRITAPTAGTLTALHATPGTQVDVGTLLAVVTPNDEPQ
ncbi:acetyl/propionyl/methylcrotonyl-CoA carboxylase subunit alpha [Streptomyces meridianus]|uniref:ATP-grasp domain-containing protein n=1 Tax=Streptomyces meridianus TaxID=2938945 RepID=A0ABT0X2R5_9ACTN|nr:biotin carboxylase N-terminal domain-containing protein [Streptomyces meridianus]MCM2576819.1 ATP-grasp domain-containing protein [Streptomyces meridianus]